MNGLVALCAVLVLAESVCRVMGTSPLDGWKKFKETYEKVYEEAEDSQR